MSNVKTSATHIALYCFCILNMLVMHIGIVTKCDTEFGLNWVSWVDNLCGIVIDVTVLFLFALFITWGKTKLSIATTFIITSIWAFCNIVYSRFFHSYITLSSIEQSSSLTDPIVLKSTLLGLQWQDLYFVLSPIIFTILYIRTKNTIKVKRSCVTAFIFMITLITTSITAHAIDCIINPDYRYLTYFSNRLFSRHISRHFAICSPITTTFHRGTIRMLGLDIYDKMKGPEELSDSQKAIITQAIKESQGSMVNVQQETSNYQNIIFIIVESYMAFTSDMIVDGKEITPNLNALKHDSTVYYNGHVQPNITIGESSDGQFIYMTGLLPLRSMITISKARKRNLPGLPKVLSPQGLTSIMIIPTQPTLWNQVEMCQRYGFDKLYSSNDIKGEHDLNLNDQQVFDFASSKDILPTISKNSFSVILTMSMHQPYIEPTDPSFYIQDSSLSEELKNYLNTCHYTDKHIGKFLDKLKQTGCYEKSLIIITADHHVHSTDFGQKYTHDLPLYIINSGIDSKTAWHGNCNQIDVYTTLLDLIQPKTHYWGLGHSLLSSSYKNSMNNIKWDISEWILQSDYFKLKMQNN